MRHPQSTAASVGADSGRRLKVGFVLTERFTLSAFAGFVDVLRLAADEGDRSRPIGCTWSVLGKPGMPITASCGLAVMPDGPLVLLAFYYFVVFFSGFLHWGQRLLP